MTKTRFQVVGLFASAALLVISLFAHRTLAIPPGCDSNKCVSDACFKMQFQQTGQCWAFVRLGVSTTQAYDGPNLYFSNGLGGGNRRMGQLKVQKQIVDNCTSPCFVVQNGIISHASNCFFIHGDQTPEETQYYCQPDSGQE